MYEEETRSRQCLETVFRSMCYRIVTARLYNVCAQRVSKTGFTLRSRTGGRNTTAKQLTELCSISRKKKGNACVSDTSVSLFNCEFQFVSGLIQRFWHGGDFYLIAYFFNIFFYLVPCYACSFWTLCGRLAANRTIPCLKLRWTKDQSSGPPGPNTFHAKLWHA